MLFRSNSTQADYATDALLRLMDVSDGEAFGKVFTQGRIYNPASQEWSVVPMTGLAYQLACKVSKDIFMDYRFEAIKFGTMVSKVSPTPAATSGKIVIWERSNRTKYQVHDVLPGEGIAITAYVPDYRTCSFFMLISWVFYGEEANDRDHRKDPEDVSMGKPENPTNPDDFSMNSDSCVDADNPSDPSESDNSARRRTKIPVQIGRAHV